MRKIIIKPEDDSPNVTKYIERFGHLPAIEARKWMKHEDLERIAGEALKRNKPIKEWEEREHIKLDSVLDQITRVFFPKMSFGLELQFLVVLL